MQYPDDLRYHAQDTWARMEDDGRVRVGITDYAQDQLGEIVFVDLPETDTDVVSGEPWGEIESSKTVADLHAPVSGTVVEVNSKLERQPELVNTDPYGEGWMLLIEGAQPAGEQLLDAEAYRRNVESR